MRQRRPASRANVYLLLLAVFIAALAGYYLPGKRPQNASLDTPRQYIELVQKKRAERLRQQAPPTSTHIGGE